MWCKDSAVSCIERGSERSGENQKECLRYLAAGTEGATDPKKTRYGAITDRAAGIVNACHRRPVLEFY